jgi:uncharacterized hydrophobic protein (TIGR00271 family)
VLRLSLSVDADRASGVAAALDRTGGVRRLVGSPAELSPRTVVLSADVTPLGAGEVVNVLRELRVPDEDYVLTHLDVVAPGPILAGPGGESSEFSWVEVIGNARANARPLARYLALMTVAAVVAASGVISANSILIVGAMAVSPDLLPVCATCVGIVGGHRRLAGGAFVTLVIGLTLVVAVAAGVTALLDLTGFLPDDFEVGEKGVGSLITTDFSTVLVALAAGVAAMLAFETRAAAAVGVAISVTTIPASAYLGVALGAAQLDRADGAAITLLVNVTLLILSGSLTLALQLWAARRAKAGGTAAARGPLAP